MSDKKLDRDAIRKELAKLNAEYEELKTDAAEAKGEILEATNRRIQALEGRRHELNQTLNTPFPRPSR